jgi:hypothetical protein
MFSKRQSKSVTVSLVAITLGTLCVATASAGAAVSITRGKPHPIWKGGTIHQCLNNKTFVTRTLPRGKHCESHETGFSFNQRGPRGQTGAAGLSASSFADDHALAPTTVPAGETVFTAKKTTITLSKPGNVLILNARLYGATIDNTSNAAVTYSVAVLIDHTVVPGALPSSYQLLVPAESTEDVPAFSTPPGSLAVGAGRHTIQIAFLSGDGVPNYVTSATGSLLAVATG